MTQLDPEKRITLEDVMSHPWYTTDCTLSHKDVTDIFTKRFKALNDDLLERSATQDSSNQRQEAYNPSYSHYSH